jgi:hypothetical protein
MFARVRGCKMLIVPLRKYRTAEPVQCGVFGFVVPEGRLLPPTLRLLCLLLFVDLVGIRK